MPEIDYADMVEKFMGIVLEQLFSPKDWNVIA